MVGLIDGMAFANCPNRNDPIVFCGDFNSNLTEAPIEVIRGDVENTGTEIKSDVELQVRTPVDRLFGGEDDEILDQRRPRPPDGPRFNAQGFKFVYQVYELGKAAFNIIRRSVKV